ncbi:hypothetical protein G7Z17_g11244 [Cylindrodendrum hubeiense]|uniref:Uncharacterized protein n=1 Tax=Cylindrodendrum hubeiense TaxID=595255 RepID=A0A9P5H0K3_9HYPO|nr:hypothetical protein G7Z17_g11244 [Cylindrodendrum hubeiense]
MTSSSKQSIVVTPVGGSSSSSSGSSSSGNSGSGSASPRRQRQHRPGQWTFPLIDVQPEAREPYDDMTKRNLQPVNVGKA